MPRKIARQFSNICPETGKSQAISITFEEINICGIQHSEYKATTFNCPHRSAHGCNSCDPYGRCPLIKKATQEINHH